MSSLVSSCAAASLGDLDGDLDAFVVNSGPFGYPGPANCVWMNDGGRFTDSGQALGDHSSSDVSLGDLDGDGDLDAFVLNNRYHGHKVWLNQGGSFNNSGQSFGIDAVNPRALSLGDLDADGDLDAVLVRDRAGRVWMNQNPPNQVSLLVDDATIGEGSGTTITATLAAPATQNLTVNLDFSGTAALEDDYMLSNTEVVIATGSMAGSITVTAVQDDLDESDETVVVEITSVINGQEAREQQVAVTILDDDEPVMPDVTLSASPLEIPETNGMSIFTANLSAATTVPVVIDLAVATSSTATAADDYLISGLQISIAPADTTGNVTVWAIQDETHEADETVTLEIVSVSGGNELGEQSATAMILDDDAPLGFRLSSFTATTGGFRATLNAELDTSVLNLGDTETGGHGPPDVVLTGAATGAVSGSLLVSADARSIKFLATVSRLLPDTYTVTLCSGVKDTSGNLLDGDGNGTAGDDFSETFVLATNTAEIGVQDFVRGPGQELNLPGNSTDGIPITISDGAAVRNASFAIDYHADLLNIPGVVPGTNMPAGSTATVDTSTPSRAVVTFTSANRLARRNQPVDESASQHSHGQYGRSIWRSARVGHQFHNTQQRRWYSATSNRQ